MYDMICSHPDLSYDGSVVSRYLVNPDKEHWKAIQCIFKYLHGSSDVCLHFGRTRDGVIGTLTPILLEILIKVDLLLGMCLLLEVVLLVGKLLYKLLLRYRLPRQNIWLL